MIGPSQIFPFPVIVLGLGLSNGVGQWCVRENLQGAFGNSFSHWTKRDLQEEISVFMHQRCHPNVMPGTCPGPCNHERTSQNTNARDSGTDA